MKTSNELRKAFLEYFNEVSHEIVASSPLPNYDNPTLLFTNAGMNQFADTFLGKEKRPYSRAVTSQKVMRVSGKHNDLENVGPSLRHHTFFEMLGNFSFGDYFKSEAIDYAWNFLTRVIGFDPERLYATVYDGTKEGKPFMQKDEEAIELWKRYLPAERIRACDYDDNYWTMGDTGPNGPCSEIHYYQGDLGNVDIDLLNNDDDLDEQFVEVWNLVFMQYETAKDGTTKPLPRPSIDTGMGLERLVRIVQGAQNNYETDLFSGALDKVQELLGDNEAQRAKNIVGYRVIADHGRASTFLIGDGLIPGNSGAPYVLRMIIRRAARFGRKIGFTQPFLAQIADTFIDQMGEAYPDIRQRASFIKKTLTQEEERFNRTLDKAEAKLADVMSDMRENETTVVDGAVAFDLLSTFGLPLEITRDIAKENGLTVDEAGYEAAKRQHAIASGKGAFGEYEAGDEMYVDAFEQLVANGTLDQEGVDYDPYSGANATSLIIGMFADGGVVETISEGGKGEILTQFTPFYVESGGEVDDTGAIMTATGSAEVVGMVKRGGLILHEVEVTAGTLQTGQPAELQVDDRRRANIRRNHTATHLLHEVLRRNLGDHVTQQGSLVAPDRLRFDFSHGEGISDETLQKIEREINAAILDGMVVSSESMDKESAIASGAMALFGEKYGDTVRTIQIDDRGGYSFELCGGLHVGNTADIGSFRFVSEGSAAAGVRRVEAVTGESAEAHTAQRLTTLNRVARQLNSHANDVVERIDSVLNENRQLQKELEQLRRTVARSQFESLYAAAETVGDGKLMVGKVGGVSADGLREMTDWFRDKAKSGVVVLATVNNDKPLFIAAVTKDFIKRGVKAGDLVRQMGKMTGGGGGGRPNLAQAGGRDVSKLDAALATVPQLVHAKL